jgi:hypothetical protein
MTEPKLTPPPELVIQWVKQLFDDPCDPVQAAFALTKLASQYGADQARPEPPADGEVAELVAWLRDRADSTSIAYNARRITRVADLLEHLAQPEPQGPRLIYRYSPVTIAECGGPCEQGPEYCDCGEITGEPEPQEPSDRIASIATAVQQCAFACEPTARLIGNVCAEDVADLCSAVLARWGRPAIEPVPQQEAE